MIINVLEHLKINSLTVHVCMRFLIIIDISANFIIKLYIDEIIIGIRDKEFIAEYVKNIKSNKHFE